MHHFPDNSYVVLYRKGSERYPQEFSHTLNYDLVDRTLAEVGRWPKPTNMQIDALTAAVHGYNYEPQDVFLDKIHAIFNGKNGEAST